MDKSKVTVTMSLQDYEELLRKEKFYKRLYNKLTDPMYVEIINSNPEPNEENLEIVFNATKYMQDNIEHFGEIEGFTGMIDKITFK